MNRIEIVNTRLGARGPSLPPSSLRRPCDMSSSLLRKMPLHAVGRGK